MKKRTLPFSAALKTTAPVAFSTMVKPIGGKCNLRCSYCYYLDKELQYDAPVKAMSEELLEEYIRQYIEGNDVPQVTFCWHGGEPLMAGIDFYKKAIEFQKKYANGKEIENTLQTNATLINREWAEFFAENNFLLGVSIDGPKDIHDANRLTANGEPTFDKVMKAIYLLQECGAEFNTLSAISSASSGRGVETYKFLKSIGSRFMQFLPVVEHTKADKNYKRDVICSPDDTDAHIFAFSIGSKDWGRFLVDIYDEWIKADVGEYFVQMFDATLANWCGVRAGVCAMNETCGDALVVEHDGSVYSCDHFVYPEFKVGNIKETDLRTLYKSRSQFVFGAAKTSSLHQKCNNCAWVHLCHGECPKHRFNQNENYLCAGLQHFFRHTASSMQYMRDCLGQGHPASLVMKAVAQGTVQL